YTIPVNGVISRTKMPIVVPVSTREPNCTIKQSTAKPLKKTIASETTNQKPRNITRKLYERVSKAEIVLFIVYYRCSKHITGNLKLLINFVEKFLGTVKFRNDQIAPILGYGDLVQGAVTIKRVYYVERLNHNLFSVGQFCDADSEVAFQKSTCYIRDLKGNDLLTGSRSMDLYSITLQDTNSPNPICLMAKATSSQAWLWHRRLSHLNFNTINLLSKYDIVVGLPKLKFVKDHLCSSCELGKAKRKSFQSKTTPSSKNTLGLWTLFLRSKDETPEVLIDFLMLVQRGLHAQLRIVRPDKGTKFLNKTLHAYFASKWILHQTSVARTPEQNDVVKRQNRTLVEAARTMLSTDKVPLFFWAKAIATTCFTQNRSLIIPRHEKTPYHIINDQKPLVKFFHIFGSLCYIVRDGENLDKMKEKDADLSETPVDQTKYRSMVGALMYLAARRPDIMHATCYCARYQAKPTKKHLTSVKRIFRYLKDTIHMGLWYPKYTGFELTGFSNSDHAGCLDSRKSTSGGIQFLDGDKLVSWSSKKQDYTSMSFAEAEYVSLSACCAQVLWMRTQLKDYGYHFDKIPMYSDSKASTAISCNPVQHSHTKHIDVRYHFIKEKVEKGIVELFFVRTEYQ
nr:uncharacterized mitochondrial protein AtMg00810-like [Tanacetum cinerariifolium]